MFMSETRALLLSAVCTAGLPLSEVRLPGTLAGRSLCETAPRSPVGEGSRGGRGAIWAM